MRVAHRLADPERGAGDEGDFFARSHAEELRRVDGCGQGDPEKESAFGVRPRAAGRQVTGERVEHDIAAARIDGAQHFNMRGEHAGLADVVVDDALGERGGVQVGGLLGGGDFVTQRAVGHDEPCHAQAGGEDLAGGAEVIAVAGPGERAERGQGFAGKAQGAIRIVLEDGHAEVRGDLHDLGPARDGEADAGGVLVVGNQIQQLRADGR
jgi:hypothetical protein